MSARPGLLVDRDGTLVDVHRDGETGTVHTAFHPSHLRFLPGVLEGLRAAKQAGFTIGVVTNQPGAAKGQVDRASIERTNAALLSMLEAEGVKVDGLEACLHHPDGGPGGDDSLVGPCDCRKPKPGMLTTLIATLDLDPARTWMIGDTGTDMEAGRAAQVRTALVFPSGRCELCPLRDGPKASADVVATTFDAVVAEILRRG